MSLHPLLGHEPIRESLRVAHRRGDLPGSLLLHGPRGVGKQRLALWLAQLVVCQAPDDEGPCGRCGPCRMALSLEHPDIHWYFPLERPKGAGGDRLAEKLETARHAELADIRAEPRRPSHSKELRALYLGTVSNLRRAAAKRPSMAGPVFIVGRAELLVPQESSQEAANALLKLLEEPPGDARIVLTSSEPGMLLSTIRSRTVPIHVPPLPDQTVRAFLEEQLGVEPKVAAWAARLSHGSPGRAMAFLPDEEEDEPGPLEALRRKAYRVVRAAVSDDPADAFELALAFPPSKARTLLALFTFVEEWLRDLAAVAAGADARVFNEDALKRLKKHVAAASVDPALVPDVFPVVERARELARGNVNPQLVVSGLVRDMRHVLRPTALDGAGPSRATADDTP